MSRILFEQGHVLTLDPAVGDFSPGDVLVEDDRIVAVGRGSTSRTASASTPAAAS